MAEPNYEVIDRERTGEKLRLNKTAVISRRASLDTSGGIVVCAGAWVSEDVLILTHDHDPVTRELRTSKLVIGKDAWIGTRAIVLESCGRIGDGAVVGAGSVVTHDIPAHELWAGDPARFIRRIEGR